MRQWTRVHVHTVTYGSLVCAISFHREETTSLSLNEKLDCNGEYYSAGMTGPSGLWLRELAYRARPGAPSHAITVLLQHVNGIFETNPDHSSPSLPVFRVDATVPQ
jgi:hypothetical protein